MAFMNKVKGIILCGGEGRRLRPLTYYFQKTMIPIGKKQKPLLEYIIKLFKYHGITDLTLLVGYKYEQIMNYFGDGSKLGLRINYVRDPNDRKGSGNALLNAYLKGVFDGFETLLIYYGDILSNIDLSDLIKHHRKNKAKATLAVASGYQVPVGVVEVNGDRVINMVEKPWLNIYATIGILTIEYEVLDILRDIAKEDLDIMSDYIPELIHRGYEVYSYKFSGFWYDIGSTEKYEKLDGHLVDELFAEVV